MPKPQSIKRVSRSRRAQIVSKIVRRGRITGRGPFLQDLKEGFNRTAAVGLRELGSAVGGIVNAKDTGRRAGAAVSKFFGFGAYGTPWNVSSNSLLRSDGGIPQVHTVADRGFNVKHTEFLGFVTSTTGFALQTYPFQPGNSVSFPWLSNIAANFSEYRVNGAIVVFKSNLTDAVASFSLMGTVSIAAEMNPSSTAPVSFVQLEQLKFCMALKPSIDGMAPIECDPKLHRNQYFVRTAAVPSGSSINDYDHCNIYVSTYGMPSAGVSLGRLYITYDVDLMEPKLLSTSAGQLTSMFDFQSITSSSPFNSSQTVVDSIGMSFSSTTMTFPPSVSGDFIVSYSYTGAVGVTLSTPSLTYSNMQLSTLPVFETGTSSLASTQIVPPVGTGAVSAVYRWIVYKPNVGTIGTITFPTVGMVPISGSTFASLHVSNLPVTAPQFRFSSTGATPTITPNPPPDEKEDNYDFVAPSSAAVPVGRRRL